MSSLIINANNITDTTTNSTFQVYFDRTINLTDKHISLTSASLYFSWRNITTQNNKFSYTWIDDIVYYVELPIGLYEIADIKSYFQFVMSQNNHVMTNTETGSTIYFIDFVVSNTAYSIDILTYPVPASLPTGTGFTSSITFTSSGARAMRGFGAMSLLRLRRSRCVFLAPPCTALRCPWVSALLVPVVFLVFLFTAHVQQICTVL